MLDFVGVPAFARENVTKNLRRARHGLAHDDERLMRFEKHLRYQEQSRRYSIAPTTSGWEVREERGDEIVRQELYHDWHRVERVRRSITLELNALRDKGWREVN